ncbi:MAG: helix-turn-helix transcriptional regulator [Lachnospiraceae bacterium]|nr:helix-turn-helix transcriptional regulator [Lachnospiraceae bacterium]
MDTIKTVQAMQEYIGQHSVEEDFSIEKVCVSVGISRRHGDRLFKKYIGKTLQEYIHAVCLTQCAQELLCTENTIMEIALNGHFQSHEGFTRSFAKRFNITPSVYRDQKIAIPLFVQYPITHYYALLKQEESNMEHELRLCMITAKERPKRKLIYLPSKDARDYLSYCEEMGCDWEGMLNSVPEKMEKAALLELPDSIVEEGFSKTASGIEVPFDYDKTVPENYRVAELPECIMLFFQSEPYENPEDFCTAIESSYEAVRRYNPSLYGYQYAYDIAPSFNFGAEPSVGGIIAVPVVKKPES